MPEITTSSTPKSKPKPVAVSAPAFEMPKFEMPKFEMPKFEVPTAFREFAEKGIAQAKENYEKVKSAAEQATDVLEDTYSTASKGCTSYGLKLIETTRTNSDATFDLVSELMTAKSYSEVVELSSA
ncbi:MAG: phasin family protein, partial [Pseudolabrys sp.]